MVGRSYRYRGDGEFYIDGSVITALRELITPLWRTLSLPSTDGRREIFSGSAPVC